MLRSLFHVLVLLFKEGCSYMIFRTPCVSVQTQGALSCLWLCASMQILRKKAMRNKRESPRLGIIGKGLKGRQLSLTLRATYSDGHPQVKSPDGGQAVTIGSWADGGAAFCSRNKPPMVCWPDVHHVLSFLAKK